MRKDWGKRLSMQIGILTMATIMIGGFSTTYAAEKVKTEFEVPFESSAIPACNTEEVFYSGIARFAFVDKTDKDGNLFQGVVMKYIHVTAETASGTQYNVHENDVSTLTTESGGDTTITTIMKGAFRANGAAVDTKVTFKLVTLIHANGDTETLVDILDIKCN